MHNIGKWFAVAIVALVASSGCKRARVLAGQPVEADGIRVVVDHARMKNNDVIANITVVNGTTFEIEVNRNQIAAVGPDLVDNFRSGSNDTVRVLPGRQQSIGLAYRVNGTAYKNTPGIWLRLDGVYAGTSRVYVPPVALGSPAHSPGNANSAFVAKGVTSGQPLVATAAQVQPAPSSKGLFRRMADATNNNTATPVAASAPPPTDGMQQYRGPRKQLRQKGTKCAAMPFKTKQIAEQMAFVLDELLLSELQQSGFEAIGPDDINAMIGFEKTKEAIGCDDVGCVAEVGNALGVDFLTAGNATSLDNSVVVTLKLIDVRTNKVVARVNKVGDSGQKGLPRMIAEAVQELVERSEL